jgi:hypothetical protein
MFSQCVKNSNGDTSACQQYLDMLTNCKKSTPPPRCSGSVLARLTRRILTKNRLGLGGSTLHPIKLHTLESYGFLTDGLFKISIGSS